MTTPYFIVKRTWGNRYLGVWPMTEEAEREGPWVKTRKEAVKFKDESSADEAADYMAHHGGDYDAYTVRVVRK